MADWSILGWQPHLADDTVHLGLQGNRHGACCRAPGSDTARYATSRPRSAAFLSDEAARECGSIALEDPTIKFWLLSGVDSRFVSATVAQRSTDDHTAPLGASRLAQSQARDFYVTFGPPSRLSPRRVTPRRGIHLNLHPRPASATSLAGRVFYQRRRRAPLDSPLGCLQVARRSLFLGRGASPLVSAEGREDTPSRSPVLLPHTRFLVLPGQRRSDVRPAMFLECRIQPPTRHNVSSRQRLLIDTPPLGTSFASNRGDQRACLAGRALLLAFKPDG